MIHRLRTNHPLTAADLKGLESTLVEIGEEDGETLLSGLLARSEAPSLAYFVRSLVGLDRSAAQAAVTSTRNPLTSESQNSIFAWPFGQIRPVSISFCVSNIFICIFHV